ncbi:AMP-binding protein [Streptomyces xanthophaeus]|uniref:AMP-binding protein n=1 Tax=Streptomyces xanthophaeus TaxID=67385 RepID=UPI003990342D
MTLFAEFMTLTAGGALYVRTPPDLIRHWIDRRQVANAYGPTEATIATHVAPHLMADVQPAPFGRSVSGVEDFLLGEDDQSVPDGQPGHLHLAGVVLAGVYAGLPDRTVHAFPRLRIGGRIDRQLNLGGVRLDPEEVEAAALTLAGLTAAAVLAEPAGGTVPALHVAVPCGRITEARVPGRPACFDCRPRPYPPVPLAPARRVRQTGPARAHRPGPPRSPAGRRAGRNSPGRSTAERGPGVVAAGHRRRACRRNDRLLLLRWGLAGLRELLHRVNEAFGLAIPSQRSPLLDQLLIGPGLRRGSSPVIQHQ